MVVRMFQCAASSGLFSRSHRRSASVNDSRNAPSRSSRDPSKVCSCSASFFAVPVSPRGSASTHRKHAWRELENTREFLSQSPWYSAPISLEKADVGLSHAKPVGQLRLGPLSFTTSIAKISAAHVKNITQFVILDNATE